MFSGNIMKSTTRIALVRPPVDILHKFSKPVESLALGYLAASLRSDHHKVFMLDGMLLDWSEEETVSNILDKEVEIVAFTIVLNHFPKKVIRILKLLRENGFSGLILVGGHAVSFFPERILSHIPEVDTVVCGEGEYSLRQIAKAIAIGNDWRKASGVCFRSGESVYCSPVKRIYDLDGIPNPARDLTADIIRLDGLVAISTSRGCYARCSFCSVPRFFGLEQGRSLASGNWIARSVNSVVSEITSLYKDFSLKELLIVDDEFFGGTETGLERALEFGRAMEERKLPLKFAISCRAENVEEHVLQQLKQGGLAHVFIGLESGASDALRLYAKGHSVKQNKRAVEIVKSLNLSFQPGFMLFNHRSTIEQVLENLEFLQTIGECKPVTINSAVDPHFGTPMTLIMKRDGVLSDKEISMSSNYLDERVKIAKTVAEICANAFQPYMNLISGLQSAITYEWRRQVPGRQEREKKLIDRFEKSVNDGFAKIVIQVVEDLGSSQAPNAEEAIAYTYKGLEDLNQQLALSQALLLTHLEQVEGTIHYWTQEEIILNLG